MYLLSLLHTYPPTYSVSRPMRCSTRRTGRPGYQVHVQHFVHVQPLLRAVERQTAGEEPWRNPRGLALTIHEPQAVAPDRPGNGLSREEDRDPRTIRCQPVGPQLHGFLQPQRSAVLPGQGRPACEGRHNILAMFKLLYYKEKFEIDHSCE